jgi:hypothetical protein
LGLLIPFIHPYLHDRLESVAKNNDVGPNAAAAKQPPRVPQARPRQR